MRDRNEYIVVLTLLVCALGQVAFAQVTTAPAADVAAEATADPKAEIQSLREKYASIITPNLVTDESTRDELAPTVLPVLKTIIACQKELHRRDASEFNRASLEQILAASIGDDSELKELEAGQNSNDVKAAQYSTAAVLVVRYWKNMHDAAAQNKILDAAAALAASKPDNEDLAGALQSMYRIGSADRNTRDRAASILVNRMTVGAAQATKLEQEGSAKLRLLEGHAMLIRGTTVDGGDFSSDKWKGKVIVVDFWATWCGPCVAGLPRLEKAYNRFHGQGLEAVSVSNDFDAAKLRTFVKAHPTMAWPQLFATNAAGKSEWNPITLEYGIGSIPKMFLIDRNGICRNVEPSDHLEEEISRLLEQR